MTTRDRLAEALAEEFGLLPATAHSSADRLLPTVDAIAAKRAAEELTDLAQRFRELGQFGAYCVVQQRIEARAAGLTEADR